jgi:hypothetical protein
LKAAALDRAPRQTGQRRPHLAANSEDEDIPFDCPQRGDDLVSWLGQDLLEIGFGGYQFGAITQHK